MTITTQAPPSFVFTVKDVAHASHVAPSAVRFYEEQGLIQARRTTGNQRRFDENAACRIGFARLAQRVGLTVREIVTIFQALPGKPSAQDWARVSDSLVAEAEARVAHLRHDLDALQTVTTRCTAGVVR
ncbi:MerR family DNA-binding transcriptional regulator [Micromonospora sp. NPDC049004]|uniref:MerR family DNA-binding transcriptional regulator n=1 Tax=Micromonospora sp. NPDC049004 TaxID=3154348 RepID=UPI0033F2452D